MNARQKRLFEEAQKKNPSLKIPSGPSPSAELTEEDLALVKQGVGDKTPRTSAARASVPGATESADQTGSIVKYFEDKGFGFIRPEGGGRDVFFHVSRLAEGDSSALVPGAKVSYELGMDRTGKMAATNLRLRGREDEVAPPPAAEAK